MKRLLYFLVGFFMAMIVVFQCSCSITREDALVNSFIEQFENELGLYEEEYTIPEDKPLGWVPRTESGNHWSYWVLRGRERVLLASCDYSYMKVRGIELWNGTYYNITDDFAYYNGQPLIESGLENLCGCVSWVNKFLNGDYYI